MVHRDRNGKEFILHDTDTGSKFIIACYVYPPESPSAGVRVFYEKTGGPKGSHDYSNFSAFRDRKSFLSHLEDVLDAAGLP